MWFALASPEVVCRFKGEGQTRDKCSLLGTGSGQDLKQAGRSLSHKDGCVGIFLMGLSCRHMPEVADSATGVRWRLPG
jgi:hypothetical protein